LRLKRVASLLMREMIAGAKPIVAAVEGYAFGAGPALGAASDYVVASETARFCFAFTRVGCIPTWGCAFRCPTASARPRPGSPSRCPTPSSRGAERLGLADEVMAAGTALAVAEAVARRFADGPPLAFEIMKAVFVRGLQAMIQPEVELQPMVWLSEEHVEGKAPVREKRRPRVIGK
jgi:enoyl-CoA hydratase/carnithine racemase